MCASTKHTHQLLFSKMTRCVLGINHIQHRNVDVGT